MFTQKLVLSYITQLFIQVFSIVVTIFVARIAGPSVLGTIAFGTAFVTMFSFILEIISSTAHIKLINDGLKQEDCITTFGILKSLLIGIYALVVIGSVFFQKGILHKPFESRNHDIVIYILLTSFVIERFQYIIRYTFTANTQQAKQDIPSVFKAIIYQVLRLIVVLLGYKAVAIATCNLIAIIAMIPVYLYLFREYKIGRFDVSLAKKYIAISVPVLIAFIAQTIVFHTDKVILQYLTNSEEVGYYTAGFRVGGFIRMIGKSVAYLFLPFFAKAIFEKKYDEVNTKINRFERFTFTYIFPFTAIIIVFSDIIVNVLLGEQYSSSINILSVITLAMFISTFTQPYGNLLTAAGKFKFWAFLQWLQAIFFVIVCYVLVAPVFFNLKGLGIAISLLLANIFYGILLLFGCKHKVPDTIIFPGKYLFSIGIILTLIAFILVKLFTISFVYKILLGIVFLLSFYGIAFLLKLISLKDLKMISDIFNARKMNKYIKEEILNK